MRDITLEELLEAGCHFGHQVTRQNPKARDFVFEARDGIHIIDLTKTKEYLDEALTFSREMAARPHASLLLVGTKRQAQDIVHAQLKRANEALEGTTRKTAEGVEEKVAANIYSVTNRWIGGTITNFSAMQKNFQRLHELTKLLASEDAREKYTKRELGLFDKERAKLESFYSGVAEMKTIPSMLFVIDTHTEDLAVREANRMQIPVVGLVDTNADPDVVTNPIPANDDAVGSIQLLTSAIVDAWIEGKLNKDKGSGIKDKEAPSVKGKEEKPAEATSDVAEISPKTPTTPKTQKEPKVKAKSASDEKPAKKTVAKIAKK